MASVLRTVVLLLLIVVAVPARTGAADLDSAELAQLDRYLDELKTGAFGRGEAVDQLADVSFVGLRRTIEAYLELEQPVAPQTHRAFQALLERISRTANLPWPLVTLYSPELAAFLTAEASDGSLTQRLFQRLLAGQDRRAFDLAVRLAPEPALRYLAAGEGNQRAELLAAWNRRLGLRAERRPIHDRDALVARIARQFNLERPGAESTALLTFAASWPAEEQHYHRCLALCLASKDPQLVLSGLSVQQRVPALVELNEPLIARWADNPAIVRAALRSYAFDRAHDHAEVLRRLWGMLAADDDDTRVACLFAMGVHSRGNDEIALSAVLEQPFAFIDVAMPILEAGDRDRARQAVQHILQHSERSREEALRLADSMKLEGFADEALRIALDEQQDGALRHTAILYLRWADGTARRKLLPFLTHANPDLRLATIQMFAPPGGLTAEDQEAIGPALIRVAQTDELPGRRQEAIFSLGKWRQPLARDFFQQVLKENPPVTLRRGYYASDEHYWRYRLRLVALVGLARLDDPRARQELVDLHEQGGPAERMDVLLAWLDLAEMSPLAFADLDSAEPKLVATAAHLIDSCGSPAERERMQKHFRRTPLWMQFENSGIDDNNLLEYAHLAEDQHAAH